jgi:hypothetical protein
MPQLKIKNEDTTVERLPMDSLKKAVAYVQTLPGSRNLKYIYSTSNEITRIENTVEIRKNQTASQWT